jgi:hypothetical protein
MARAASIQRVDMGRISYMDTLRWLITADPAEEMPALLINLLRPDCLESRGLKRRVEQYDLINRPRAELLKQLEDKRVAV